MKANNFTITQAAKNENNIRITINAALLISGYHEKSQIVYELNHFSGGLAQKVLCKKDDFFIENMYK